MKELIFLAMTLGFGVNLFGSLQFKNIGRETYKVKATFNDGTQQIFEVKSQETHTLTGCLKDLRGLGGKKK